MSCSINYIRTHYKCEGRIEKSVPRDHRLSILSKPRAAKRRSPGRIFLSYPHTHDRFLYSPLCHITLDVLSYPNDRLFYSPLCHITLDALLFGDSSFSKNTTHLFSLLCRNALLDKNVSSKLSVL